VGTQKDFDVMQTLKVVVVDCDEPHAAQTLTLHAVMHYIAEAIQRLSLSQFFLCLAYGSGYSEAETAAAVNLYL